MQAYASHQHKSIFNVNALDLQRVAPAFGFLVPPRVNLNVHSSKGERIQRRGGGGGFGAGYKSSKLQQKAKIFSKRREGMSDSSADEMTVVIIDSESVKKYKDIPRSG
ncbi:ATP-dependent RNA helicase ddx18 [Desmophyllum pertusum]|uniref:ATP-dependent RNA helicase ddx18 n=1 Tax=Desmophyllum pertusum TaxID=174260 RepID=A0A9X0DDW2_9CNID|nr:ATP-dependent RNA helicase ddx18 [Desmophyllum pertusum]